MTEDGKPYIKNLHSDLNKMRNDLDLRTVVDEIF